jgi:uncharacterized protein YndB with AHSA1/START domain
MMPTNKMTQVVEDRVLTLTRTFDAPRERVFAAFSQCEHLEHWWGPSGWTLPVCEMDFRPGGTWYYCMGGPDGENACGLMTYHEIVAPERIVATDGFADEEGNLLEEMPRMRNTLIFREQDGQTTLTNQVQFASAADLEKVLDMGMMEGITQTFDRLDAYLETL